MCLRSETEQTVCEDDLPIMDYRSVGQHNNSKSAYVVVDQLIYDITKFLNRHPGGAYILTADLGTDITNTFQSYHDSHIIKLIRSENFRRRNDIRLVAKLASNPADEFNLIGHHKYQSRRAYRQPDPMGEELKAAVMEYIRRNRLPLKKSIAECLVLLSFYYSLYIYAMYNAFILASPIWCLLLGPIVTFMLVNVGHTTMHGGFSNSAFLNVLGRSLGDAGGYSSSAWGVEHQGHHQAPHTKIDLQTTPPSIVRFFEHQERMSFQRYQMYYMWFVFIFFSPVTWIAHSYNTLFNYPSILRSEKVLHVSFKLVCFVFPISMSFFLFGFKVAIINFFLFAFSVSYFTLFCLFIQHEDSYLLEDGNESWSVRQVSTSVSWDPKSRIFEWLFGYFNYHTEHHLFPSVNPSIYPKIQPIVKSICAKHNVEYKHISYPELVKSQLRAWIKYSSMQDKL